VKKAGVQAREMKKKATKKTLEVGNATFYRKLNIKSFFLDSPSFNSFDREI